MTRWWWRWPGSCAGGIWLAAGVMALDVTANWIGNWPSLHEDPARLLLPVGLAPITLFGVFVLVTALPMLHVMKTGGQDHGPWPTRSTSARRETR